MLVDDINNTLARGRLGKTMIPEKKPTICNILRNTKLNQTTGLSFSEHMGAFCPLGVIALHYQLAPNSWVEPEFERRTTLNSADRARIILWNDSDRKSFKEIADLIESKL